MSKGEREPLLKGVKKDIILDPTSDISGFVASELGQEELLQNPDYIDAHTKHTTVEQTYSATNSNSSSLNEDLDGDAVGNDELAEEPISPARRNVILLSMYLGVFLSSLDSTIVTTLIARIASEFDALPKLSWIATSYLVSSATFQPLYGKLSDIFGRRALLLFCNLSFAIGCLICFLAPNVETLIFGRFLSGAGGGGLNSLTSITTSDLIPLKSRGVYQGLCNVAFGIGTAVGSIVGGVFADHPSLGGWRGAFFVQVPLTLLSAFSIYTFLKLPEGSPGLGVTGDDIGRKLKLIDWNGSLTLITFLLLFLTIASLGGKEIPYDSFTFIFLSALTFLALLAFIYVELHAKNPTLPLTFFSIPTVTGVSLSNFFTCICSFNTYFIIPIYFTAVLGLNSTEIGKRFSPNFFSIVIGSLGAGVYMKRTGRYRTLLILAGAIAIFGTYRIFALNPSYTNFEQYILLITPGIGFSVIITATLLALIAAVPHEHQAATTSISYLFRSCGSTLGVAIGSAIFNKKLEFELKDKVLKYVSDNHSLEELNEIIYKASHSSEYVQKGAPRFIRDTLINAYSVSARSSFGFSLVAAVLAFLSLFLIKEYTLHSTMKRK